MLLPYIFHDLLTCVHCFIYGWYFSVRRVDGFSQCRQFLLPVTRVIGANIFWHILRSPSWDFPIMSSYAHLLGVTTRSWVRGPVVARWCSGIRRGGCNPLTAVYALFVMRRNDNVSSLARMDTCGVPRTQQPSSTSCFDFFVRGLGGTLHSR